MKLLRSTEEKINKNKNGEKFPHSEITEVVLIHVINNDYQRDSRYAFEWIKRLLIQTLLIYWCMVYVQNSKPLEIEDKINITLFIT